MKKTVLLIYVLAFAVSFMLASHVRAAVTYEPVRNGHGVGGYGDLPTTIDIPSVKITAIDSNRDGEIDSLNLEWRQGPEGNYGLSVWHHSEVRYSDVNGKNGKFTNINVVQDNLQATRAPWLYPTNANDPDNPQLIWCTNGELYQPNCLFYKEARTTSFTEFPGGLSTIYDDIQPFGPHTAIINDMGLLKNKIVRFQIAEWWWYWATNNFTTSPQKQAVVAVTPPIVINDLKPGSTVTLSNTNVMDNSSVVSSTNYNPTYSSSGDENSANLSINKEVITGEEYLLRIQTSFDLYGNINPYISSDDNVDYQRTGANLDGLNSVIEYSDLQNPRIALLNNASDVGILFLPRRTDGKPTETKYTGLYKKNYYNLFPNSGDYDSNEQILNFGQGLGSAVYDGSPSGASGGTITQYDPNVSRNFLDQINNFHLTANIELTNIRPQLSMQASSCTPQADMQQGNEFRLKAVENTPPDYRCYYKFANTNLGTRIFRIEPNRPASDQVFDFSNYPSGLSVNPGNNSQTFYVDVNTNGLDFPYTEVEARVKEAFKIKSAPIPSISSVRGGDIFTIASDPSPSGPGLQPYSSSKPPAQVETEKNFFISMYSNEIVGQEQAGIDWDACPGETCRIGELDLRKGAETLSCKLSGPASAKLGSPIALVWGILGLESPTAIILSNDQSNKLERSFLNTPSTKTYTDTAPTDMPVNNQINYSLTISDTHNRNTVCYYPVSLLSQQNPQAFQAVFIANGSVNITRTDPLTIKYDTRFLNSVPPGFCDLLAPLWKEK
ncbi:MAG: hypothetical protein M1338_00310 [Patescibacteria group bacterium]|nr:hypothetical protein [Patescibacteria group bacterium]